MTDIQEQSLALLRAALWGGELPPIRDLPAVKQELQDQAVLTLAADVLGMSGDRDAVREAANRLTHFYAMMTNQQTMLKLLSDAQIPCVVLKGAAAAVYYPKPEYRKLGDVDLLVPPEHFDAAAGAIRAAGYEQYLDKQRHLGFSVDVTRFELHRHFSETGAAPLDDLLFAAMPRREQGELSGFAFPMLPGLENGVVLLEHLAQHLKGSAGLRQVLDFVLYCHETLTDEYYTREFAPVIRPLGLETLAVTAARLGQLHLGLTDSITWCRGADETLCDAMLEQIFRRGNFGVKDTAGASAVSVLNMAKNPIKFLGQLQTMGCATWQALKKYPVLKPFAWLYQLCRFIRRGFARKDALGQLRRDKQAADTQAALLQKLGLDP
ncbi:MAG: nucleotidyltransferase family protein [Oscillospiraceae bacterium]|nr:nucleotidyltransferase family protein [Oscillospiraceae bacterium]